MLPDHLHYPRMKLTYPRSRTRDTPIRMGHITLNVIDPSGELCVRSNGPSKDADDFNNHGGPTPTPEHVIIIEIVKQPTDASRGKH